MLSADAERGIYEIVRLMIDKRFQNKGFGTAAIKLALAELKGLGADKALVRVEPDNENTVSMHKKLGFEFTGRMEHGKAFMECQL